MYRFDDYAAASIPVMPVKNGNYATKIHILLYIIAFMVASCLLTYFGLTGLAYLIVATLVGLAWLTLSIKGFKATNDKLWPTKCLSSRLSSSWPSHS